MRVIGVGVGEQHIKSYRSLEGVEVCAICDLDTERLHEVADRYEIEKRETDYRRVTENPDIDVISICSFDNFTRNRRYRRSCMRNMSIEKPVALFRPEVGRSCGHSKIANA